MMNINVLNKIIKKSRRWYKKTNYSFFKDIATRYENKKKDKIFTVIDDLNIQPETNIESQSSSSESRIIWICWFQGLDNAPELVKRCIESVQLHSPDAKVVILTDDNIPLYLSLPDYIKEKYERGLISKAQYSDIVRCSLLYQYGGIWMDATVFITKPVPGSFYENTFSSLRFEANEDTLSQGYWTAYFLSSQKSNQIIKFVRDVLYRYWQHHDTLIEYFLIDYSFLYARERYPQFRRVMDEQPVTGNSRFLLRQYMNLSADSASITVLSNDHIGIYKLSHKERYITSHEGQPTIYSNILSGSFKLN